MKSLTQPIGLVLLAVVAFFVFSAAYTVQETEQVIITQFGKPVGDPVTEAGLHFKKPFIQEVKMFEKRILEWDGSPTEMPTKDKTFIIVDTFGRWRIRDAKQYFLRLRDERSALSRLDDILGNATRDAIARHDLIELIRSTKDRVPMRDDTLKAAPDNIGVLYPIEKGRPKIESEIYQAAVNELSDLGIELLDIRFKRINYNRSVQQRIFERMISEREQIADRFRSEGAGEAAKIIGNKEKDLQEIESLAYKQVQEVRGKADAKATEIYAKAYNASPQAAEFYQFMKTLETYQDALRGDSTLILSTDSDIFRYLKSTSPEMP